MWGCKVSFKSNNRWSQKAESDDSMEWLDEPVRYGTDSFIKSMGRINVERQCVHKDVVHVSQRWAPVLDDKLNEGI